MELAFLLPVFLSFLLGVMEFSRAYWILDSMQFAVDEAGRYAMLNTSAADSQIVSTAKSNLYSLNSSNFTVTSVPQTSGGINYKVITATYSFGFIVPDLLPYGNLTLTRSTTVPLIP